MNQAKPNKTIKQVKVNEIIERIKLFFTGFTKKKEDKINIPPQWKKDKKQEPEKQQNKKLFKTIKLKQRLPRISISDMTRAQKIKKFIAFILLIAYSVGAFGCVKDRFFEGLIICLPTALIILDYLGTGLQTRTKWTTKKEDTE